MIKVRKSWSEEEIEFLKINFSEYSNRELSIKMDRTMSSIEKKAKYLGIKKNSNNRTMSMKWTDEDLEFLVNNYSNMTNAELSNILGRSPKTILNRASKMGINKSDTHRSTINKENSIKATRKSTDKETLVYKYKCEMCDSGSNSIEGLSIHLTKSHNFDKVEMKSYYNKNNEIRQCSYCNNESKFLSLSKGYSDKCDSIECLSKSRAYNTKEWHETNNSQHSDYTNNRLKTLKINDDKRLEDNPNYYKEKSHNSKEYWLKRGYSEEESIINSLNVVDNMQSASHKIRRENPEDYKYVYNTKIEYYINKGISEDDALDALTDRQRTFSKEICIEKHGEYEGMRIWSERQEKWMKTLDSKSDEEKKEINFKKIKNCAFKSKISQELFDSIYEIIRMEYKSIYYGELNKEFHLYNNDLKKHCLYDFVIMDIKKCIEFNGWFWHCKPTLYEGNYFNKVKKMYAHEIWENDKIKNDLIKKEGYDLLIIWEDDYKKDKKGTVQKCIDFLLNDNRIK